jgi:ribose transport system ATP-binding protein
VAENFALSAGFPTGPTGGIRWRRLRDRVTELLALYQIDAHPETEIGALRPATKTLVAIARALQDQQDSEFVLLLDEPTASLPDAESRALMTALRNRADSGQTIVLVSHRLPEVLDVADDFTVFRDGRVTGSLIGVSPSEDDLVELMTGRRPAPRQAVADPRPRGGPTLEVENLTIGPLRGLNLEVAAGEIVGLCGLLGSGRSTLLSTIFGLRAPIRGSIRLAGEEIASRPVQEIMRRGVALIPQNRLLDAAFAGMSVRENVSVAVLRRYFSGWMRGRAERTDATDLVRRFGVKAASTEVPLTALSGGNQQKLVLARWLRREPRLLLLDEPTQGVDAAARTEIHAVIREAAARGCAVLVASSDFPELARLCHRVDVLRGGRVALEITGPELTANRLTELAQKEVLSA